MLRKPNNDVRPIDVGETLRRLVSYLLICRHTEPISELLQAHQVGVSTRNVSDAIIHAVRQLQTNHGHDDTMGLLQLDFQNAFNLISRAAFRRQLRIHLPNMLRWVDYCYGGKPRPWANVGYSDDHEDYDAVICSATGVQQGDPLGPFLFAIALQPIIDKYRQKMAAAVQRYADALRKPCFLAFHLDDDVIIAYHTLCGDTAQSPT